MTGLRQYTYIGALVLVIAGIFRLTPVFAGEEYASACASAPPSAEQGVPGKVMGFPGQRAYLTTKHPDLCATDWTTGCDPHAYVLSGDSIKIGPACQQWTFVQFDGKKKSSSGWLANERIETLQPNGPKPIISGKSPPSAPVCAFVRDTLNTALRTATSTPAFSSPLQNIHSLDTLPSKVESHGWQTWNIQVADARLGTQVVKAVSYSTGGTCWNSVVEFWTPDFSKRIPVEGSAAEDINERFPDEFGGYTSQQLIEWNNQAFFLQYSRAARHVLVSEIDAGLSSHLVCVLSQRANEREIADASGAKPICAAALAGLVEDISLPTNRHPDEKFIGSDLGDYVNFGSGSLSGSTWLDVRNQGKPELIAMAYSYDASGAGCGSDHFTQWPVILSPDGTLDMHNPFNKVAFEHAGHDDDSRLFRYRGAVYFERRSLPIADSRDHEIWKFSGNSAELMCRFSTVQYAEAEQK